MRIVLTLLIGIHGTIHLFGFLKAYEISQFDAISQSISKTQGLFWLLTFLLFAFTFILILYQSNFWWVSCLPAVIISQVLIFNVWADAKFGTIANIILLCAAVIGYASFNFKEKIKTERIKLFENSVSTKSQKIVTEQSLRGLPPIVQKWLKNSGIVGKKLVSNVHLTQEVELRLKPEQSTWNTGSAEQYFTTHPPAFNWNINTQMNAMLSVVGRDKFEDGKGEMTIKLLSLIPVAHAKNEEKVNQATLQRYLAEIVWFPSASVSEYITWETLNDSSAKATMEYNGTKGSGEFHFDEHGNFEKFVALRYKDSKDAQPTEWTVTATRTEERNGIKIPIECQASWELKNGQWTWLKLKITNIEYNVEIK